ncbi:hypothetical protein AB07_4413 [Citrobacter freundii]|nr:hypothetical protein AB07_4413 [Citrobacter freundii]
MDTPGHSYLKAIRHRQADLVRQHLQIVWRQMRVNHRLLDAGMS